MCAITVDTVHHLGKSASVGDEEDCRLHVAAIGRLLASADVLDKLEHALTNHLEHIVGTEVLEHMPAQIFVGYTCSLLVAHSLRIYPQLSVEEGGVLYLTVPVACVLLLLQLLVVEHLHKKDVRHLLQNGNGVSDASHKERVPYLVDFVFYLACYHLLYFCDFVTKLIILFVILLAAIKNNMYLCL